MSSLELRLKAARDARGLWHKQEIIHTRIYINATPKSEMIEAIKTIKDQTLLRTLWEVGLDTELQLVVTEQSRKLAGEAGEGVS
jgi:hypothetical protein